MVIFYVSDRHGAVCLSVSCDVLWCLALSLSPVALGTNPRLSMSFFGFFFLPFLHPSLLFSPLSPAATACAACWSRGDACAVLLPRSQERSVLGQQSDRNPTRKSPRGVQRV